MTCRQTEPQLNALADRALSPWQAWRVRRHLSACPACAAHLADIQRLDTAVQVWQDAPMPSDLAERIAAVLPSAPRRTLPVRPAAVGLAGLAAALAAFFWFLPGQPGQPIIAFGDVEKAMASVNVIDWTDETTQYRKSGTITDYRAEHVWLRRIPAAVATIIPPNPSQPFGMKMLEDKRGTMTFLPGGRTAVSPHQVTVYGTVAAYNSLFIRPLRVLGQENAPKLEATTVNGQPEFKTTLSWHFPQDDDLQTTLWIDPVTKRLIRLETRSTSGGRLRYISIDTQMRYDETPPAGVFDWSRPAGKVMRL